MKKITFIVILIFTVVALFAFYKIFHEDSKNNLSKYIIDNGYKNTSYVKTKPKITKHDIKIKIKHMRQLASYDVEKKKGFVKKGDTVKLDYIGKTKNKEIENEKDELVTIGSNQCIKEFENELCGMKIGSSKIFDIKFPDNYQNKKMAGKTITFDVHVKSLVLSVLPKFDDDFVKKQNIKNVNTIFEYKKYIKKQVEQEKKLLAKETNDTALLGAVLSSIDVKKDKNGKYIFPEKDFKYTSDKINSQYENQAKELGLSYDEYIKNQMNMSKHKFKKYIKNLIEETLRKNLVIRYIAEKENITVTNIDFDNYIKKQIKIHPEINKKSDYDDYKKTDEFKYEVLKEKVLKFLYKKIKIV